jgi:hypothetical protein
MDPVMKIYMFYQWMEDNNEQIELFKNHGYLIGSFSNPEAVKKILGGDSRGTSEEDFEEASKAVREAIDKQVEREQNDTVRTKRRRKKKVN